MFEKSWLLPFFFCLFLLFCIEVLNDLAKFLACQFLTKIAELKARSFILSWIELALKHFEMFQNIKPCHRIFFVDFVEFWTKELFEELLEMDIDKFATPLAPTRRWKKLFAKKAFVRLTR